MNFSRTVWITFQCRGTTSKDLGNVLAKLDELGVFADVDDADLAAKGLGELRQIAYYSIDARSARRVRIGERLHAKIFRA